MLEVIGIGMPRTGTMSMKHALERLGYGPCYHMYELIAHPEHVPLWLAAKDGTGTWDQVFEGYRSTTDFPGSGSRRELCGHYPDAKVILTARAAPGWYASMENSVLRVMRSMGSDSDEPAVEAIRRVAPVNAGTELHQLRGMSREEAIALYSSFNASVIAEVSPERLLVFEAAQGWKPLCSFLGVDVPDEPYPHLNAGDSFRDHFA